MRFYKLKGHSGNPQNELADVLAVMASRGTVVKQYGKVGNYDAVRMMNPELCYTRKFFDKNVRPQYTRG